MEKTEDIRNMQNMRQEEILDTAKNLAVGFWKDETASGVVEMILIIVVLIALVVIFRDRLKSIVNSIFNTISSKAGSV